MDIQRTPIDAIRQNIRTLIKRRKDINEQRQPLLIEVQRIQEEINEIDDVLDNYETWMKANGHV